MKFSIRLLAAGLVLISAASVASAQTYWGYNYGDAGPRHKVITGRRMMAVLNTAAAVAISTAMGRATVMPAKRQADGTQHAIESVAQ